MTVELEDKASAQRMTLQTLKSGQERAYGPSINVTRVWFEIRLPWHHEPELRNTWQPFDIVEERVRERLLGAPCGFTEFTYPPKDREATASDYFATRLVYLKKLEPGVWEFRTEAKYTG